jgi:hypothetical protein
MRLNQCQTSILLSMSSHHCWGQRYTIKYLSPVVFIFATENIKSSSIHITRKQISFIVIYGYCYYICFVHAKGNPVTMVKLLPCDHEVMGSSPGNSLL